MKLLGTASNSKDLKVLNRILVLNTIRKNGPIARHEVAKRTGLTPPTVTVIVNDLIKMKIVNEIGWGESNGGRRPVNLELNPGAGYIFAVRIQQGEIVTAILDLASNILESRRQMVDTIHPDDVVSTIGSSFDSLVENNLIPTDKIIWCGVASPGLVNSFAGQVERSSNLIWGRVPLGEMLSERIGGIPVHVENISNAAALGEKVYGSGRGYSNLIYLNLSVGIGAGIIINNEVFGGASGYAGEVGHIEVSLGNGERYSFEAYCGILKIIERVKTRVPDEIFTKYGFSKARIGISDLFAQPLADIPKVKEIILEVGNIIGIKVANLISLFNTEMVILGGELGRSGTLILEIVNHAAKESSLKEMGESVKIISSSMQEDPPLMGVYALVLEKVFNIGLSPFEQEIVDSKT